MIITGADVYSDKSTRVFYTTCILWAFHSDTRFMYDMFEIACPDVMSRRHHLCHHLNTPCSVETSPRMMLESAAKAASDSVCKRVEGSQLWLVSVD